MKQFGIIRNDDKLGKKEQRKIVADYGVAVRDIHEEKHKREADGFPIRDWAIDKATRKGAGDEIVYAYFWLADTQLARLAPMVRRVHVRGAVIVEAATSKRSDNPGDLLEMHTEARRRYSGHWLTPDQARAMAEKSASPVGKIKKGRMPWAQAVKIIDAASSVDVGVARINQDRRFKTAYNRVFVYAMNRDDKNKVKLKPRISGRVQREILGLPAINRKK